jgi:hypothetical protein
LTDAPHESPAAFEAVLSLIHLITNPSQCRKRLSDLADAKAACRATIELARRERAEADAKLAELAAKVALETKALDDRSALIARTKDEIGREAVRQHIKRQSEPFDPPKFGHALAVARGARSPADAARLLIERTAS